MLYNARTWSNIELKEIFRDLEGDVINVSGEFDKDKEGGVYKDYFPKAKSYSISNYEAMGIDNEIILDLEKELPDKLVKAYDVVYSHTILEHIFEIRKAFANLCLMSRQVMVAVVPFVQEVHYKENVYYDYWRPTPFAFRKMYEENGFEMIYLSHNNMDYTNSYIICVGVRKELVEKYGYLDNRPHDNHVGAWIQKYGSEWSEGERRRKIIKDRLLFWK